MALAAFDPLAGVITNATAMTIGFHALTVEYGRRRSAALAVSFPNERAQRVIEGRPLVVEGPLPENMIDRLPRGKVGGQITPRAATLDDIENGIEDAPTVSRRASAFGGFGEHGFEVSPLGIRETGLIYGVFHAPTEAALKMSRPSPSRMSTHPALFFHAQSRQPLESQRQSKNSIIQTGNKAVAKCCKYLLCFYLVLSPAELP